MFKKEPVAHLDGYDIKQAVCIATDTIVCDTYLPNNDEKRQIIKFTKGTTPAIQVLKEIEPEDEAY